jgi:cysteine desulfurase
MQQRLLAAFSESFPHAKLNGSLVHRLPNNVNVSFPGHDSRAILTTLDELGIAASAGSACNEEVLEPSHVLLAMDVPLRHALGTLRLTFSAETTDRDIDTLLAALPRAIEASYATEGAVAG